MTVSEIIAEAASLPFAGAAHVIRRIDPFWQTEIGVERGWEARFVQKFFDKCDCPNCDGCRERRGPVTTITVEALDSITAAEIARSDQDPWQEFEGVRLLGSSAPFAEPAA